VPQTVLTALKALQIGRRIQAAEPAAAGTMRTELLAARRFCWRMTYHPCEAYFAAHPEDWVGAVRVRPDASTVSVGACAAALEALLAD
jgi:hypothetical protein